MFNEISLRDEIYRTWGMFSTHADVYRELLRRISPSLSCRRFRENDGHYCNVIDAWCDGKRRCNVVQ